MQGKGRVQTSSPFSPLTAWPASSKAATAMPSPAVCNSPAHTGAVGLPSTKQDTMSVPPLIEARWMSVLMAR